MKLGLMLALLLVSQVTLAESVRGKKLKEEMITRIDSLITKISDGRDALEQEDVAKTCEKINEVFKLLPEHLIAIGTNMNLLNSKVILMEQETKMVLIYIHQRSNICASSSNPGENLDLKETEKKLKSISKMLVKQKKLIKKLSTEYRNTYNYYYEF
jgi:hypothetical protein